MKKNGILFLIGLIFFFQKSEILAITEAEKKEAYELKKGKEVVEKMENDSKNEKGIYVFDGFKQKIVKFLNYNDEFNSTSIPKITNGLEKAIYSIGEGIFMKNFGNYFYKNNDDLSIGDFGEINTNENSVKLFQTKKTGDLLTLSWKDEDKFDGYLIQIKDNVDGFLNGGSKNLFYLLEKDVLKSDENDIENDINNAKNDENDKNFSKIKQNLNLGEKDFLTEKSFSKGELKIILNENFFYAKIFGIKDGKISTGSAQKILFGDKEKIKMKEIGTVEKINLPILIENSLNISDLFYTEKQNGDTISWDLNGDRIFEKNGDSVILPIKEDLGLFYLNLLIKKANGEKFIKLIKLNFFSPEIFFDREEDGKIFGHIEPKINKFPVSYTYENETDEKKFSSEKILTDENGEFNFLKKSEKKYREIYLENKEVLGKIFLETGNVELKFNEKRGDFLVISRNTDSGKEIISIIYFNGKIETYDKNYQITFGENGKDFYLNKFGKKDFYFNFGIKIK